MGVMKTMPIARSAEERAPQKRLHADEPQAPTP
jgi:hypothetical protein